MSEKDIGDGDEERHRMWFFSLLESLKQDNLPKTMHQLEAETQIFFDLTYFEEMLMNGNWGLAEYYLYAFISLRDADANSESIVFKIRMQKILERESPPASSPENQLSRATMVEDVKKLVKENVALRNKLKFPRVPGLKTMLGESFVSPVTTSARSESQSQPCSIALRPTLKSSSQDEGSKSHNGDGVRRIGKLKIFEQQLGYSYSTIVWLGEYDKREVAVKGVLSPVSGIDTKEVDFLIASDSHRNIVRYFGKEADNCFQYLVLEKCDLSLYALVLKYDESEKDRESHILWNGDLPAEPLMIILRDIVRGLGHLHQLNIIHRDLKSQNILLTHEVLPGRAVMHAKISDMGISKRLSEGLSSCTNNNTGTGTTLWQAPEQTFTSFPHSKSIDMYSLGCIIYFCLSKGCTVVRGNENDIDVTKIRNQPLAVELISNLICVDANSRPKIDQVLMDPLFWNPGKRLEFIRDAYERVNNLAPGSQMWKEMEADKHTVFVGKWNDKFGWSFLKSTSMEPGKKSTYDYESLVDLLKLVRNKVDHKEQLPADISYPEGLEQHFSNLFPGLLLYVYHIIYKFCKEDDTFKKKYFNVDI